MNRVPSVGRDELQVEYFEIKIAFIYEKYSMLHEYLKKKSIIILLENFKCFYQNK